MYRSARVVAALLAIAAATPISPSATPSNISSDAAPSFFASSAPTRMVPLTADTDFNFILYLGLDIASGGGAGVNDILTAASYIEGSSIESFAQTFWALANQTLAQAQSIEEANPDDLSTRITVRDSYIAASTYYQFADFYLHGNPSDPRLKQLWASQKSAFIKGLERLSGATAEPFNIPTKYNFSIPGYYYRVDDCRRPTIIITTGYDGPQEQYLTWLGPQILQHGWNFITYEGPGQPTVVHEQGIGFRPDWEVVVSPVIDWLAKQPTADLSRLTSFGMSMGGYLAARAAAFESRIKAQVLNGGIFSVYEAYSYPFGPLLKLLDSNKTAFDEYVYKNVLENPNTTTADLWGVQQGLYTFNTRSPADWLLQARAYTAKEWVDRIHIPTWIVNATQDSFFPNQSLKMAAALSQNHVPVTLQTMPGLAGLHDQVGASLELNRKMWPWINRIWPNSTQL